MSQRPSFSAAPSPVAGTTTPSGQRPFTTGQGYDRSSVTLSADRGTRIASYLSSLQRLRSECDITKSLPWQDPAHTPAPAPGPAHIPSDIKSKALAAAAQRLAARPAATPTEWQRALHGGSLGPGAGAVAAAKARTASGPPEDAGVQVSPPRSEGSLDGERLPLPPDVGARIDRIRRAERHAAPHSPSLRGQDPDLGEYRLPNANEPTPLETPAGHRTPETPGSGPRQSTAPAGAPAGLAYVSALEERVLLLESTLAEARGGRPGEDPYGAPPPPGPVLHGTMLASARAAETTQLAPSDVPTPAGHESPAGRRSGSMSVAEIRARYADVLTLDPPSQPRGARTYGPADEAMPAAAATPRYASPAPQHPAGDFGHGAFRPVPEPASSRDLVSTPVQAQQVALPAEPSGGLGTASALTARVSLPFLSKGGDPVAAPSFVLELSDTDQSGDALLAHVMRHAKLRYSSTFKAAAPLSEHFVLFCADLHDAIADGSGPGGVLLHAGPGTPLHSYRPVSRALAARANGSVAFQLRKTLLAARAAYDTGDEAPLMGGGRQLPPQLFDLELFVFERSAVPAADMRLDAVVPHLV